VPSIPAAVLNGIELAHFGPALLAAVVAGGAVMAAVPIVQRVAPLLGAIDRPGGRHIHAQATPRLGGIAMLLGFATAVLVLRPPVAHLGALLLAGACIAVIMSWDDAQGLSPRAHLLAQVGVAALAAVLGIRIESVSLPGGLFLLGWLAYPATLLWLVGMQNTVNLLDGIDGLAAGVVAIVAGALVLAAINVDKPEQVALAGALLGACLGFLAFNRYPARIFMGDSGSHFLGFTVGALSILGVSKVPVVFAVFVPLLALGLPIVDTGWAIWRRRRQGVPVVQADSAHLHHRLLALGLSQRETAAVFYLATALLSAIGLTIYGHKKILLIVAVVSVIGLSTMAIDHLQQRGEQLTAAVENQPSGSVP
jgi:UDP-GlcNAc:undecaprenyl-phosphate GlcNAc-1-phosphate transferase